MGQRHPIQRGKEVHDLAWGGTKKRGDFWLLLFREKGFLSLEAFSRDYYSFSHLKRRRGGGSEAGGIPFSRSISQREREGAIP